MLVLAILLRYITKPGATDGVFVSDVYVTLDSLITPRDTRGAATSAEPEGSMGNPCHGGQCILQYQSILKYTYYTAVHLGKSLSGVCFFVDCFFFGYS